MASPFNDKVKNKIQKYTKLKIRDIKKKRAEILMLIRYRGYRYHSFTFIFLSFPHIDTSRFVVVFLYLIV